jgi:ferredoxin-type protein NapH
VNCTNCGRCIDVCDKDVFSFGTRFAEEQIEAAKKPLESSSGQKAA